MYPDSNIPKTVLTFEMTKSKYEKIKRRLSMSFDHICQPSKQNELQER